MTDPLRRDPLEFLRVLKKMANNASWQKTLLFSAKGRQVGYKLGIDHYNTILFSQSMWGRALEIIKTIRNMEEDGVQPNGATYYYICNGMANAEHGYQYDFPTNPMLHKLQHWRVALNALEAAEANGFDTTDTMHNSVIISCTIPTMNNWEQGLKVLHKMLAEDRKMHPTMVDHLKNCLIRNRRPFEASWLLQKAAEAGVEGFEHNVLTSPAYRKLHAEQRQGDVAKAERRMQLSSHQPTTATATATAALTSSTAAEDAAASPSAGEGEANDGVASSSSSTAAPPSTATTPPKRTHTASGMGTSDYYRSLLTKELAAIADHYDETRDEAQLGNVGRTKAGESRRPHIPALDRYDNKVPDNTAFNKALAASEAAIVAEHEQRGARGANPNALTPEEEAAWQAEVDTPELFSSGQHDSERMSHFRPRVHRQEWYKWHAIANKYRPHTVMRKKQLAPRDSPTGLPGFGRI